MGPHSFPLPHFYSQLLGLAKILNFNLHHHSTPLPMYKDSDSEQVFIQAVMRWKNSAHWCQLLAYAFLAFIAFIAFMAFLGAAAAAFAAFLAILLSTREEVNFRECKCHSRLASLSIKWQQKQLIHQCTQASEL